MASIKKIMVPKTLSKLHVYISQLPDDLASCRTVVGGRRRRSWAAGGEEVQAGTSNRTHHIHLIYST